MSEEIAAPSSESADPVALSLALVGASREKADAYLDDQRQHLHEQLRQIHLDIFEKWLGVALRLATLCIGIAAAAAVALMVWDAAHSNGLVIQPFSVPPDLTSQGASGQVIASQMLDKLMAMQADTISARPAKSYANDWSREGIRLEIPETGVSLNELDAFLHDRLGHDTHITGEIIRTPSGLSLTARAGAEGARTVTGSPADLDGLVQKSAEAIYRLTQPFRYGMYLASHDRAGEAISVFAAVAQSGPRQDRAWAYPYWALLSGQQQGLNTELGLVQQAISEEPENIQAQLVLGTVDAARSLPEQAIQDWRKTARLLSENKLGMYSPQAAASLQRTVQASIDMQLGNFHDAAQASSAYVRTRPAAASVVAARLAGMQANDHDPAAARATLADIPNFRLDFQSGHTALYTIEARLLIDRETGSWAALLAQANAAQAVVQKYPGIRSFLGVVLVPLTAYAEARLGRMKAAETHIAQTPADCYGCLIARARIAELRGQKLRADWFFARAISGQKSIPFAYSYWGEAWLARGKPGEAIEKFQQAQKLGPKFADPLEGWGEALMAKNRSHLALAKFEEANKYAPNWGRLHLKWGEALAYAGKPADARAQFARAATLDLTPSEKAELNSAQQKPM